MGNLLGKRILLTLMKAIERNVINNSQLNIPLHILNWRIYDSTVTNDPIGVILILNPSKTLNL